MASLRRINQDDLRNHNLSVVIDTLLRASGPMSRADLAKETGLTKATMSLLVSLLIDAGVVKEGEPQNSASYGRPSTPLMLGGGKVCGVGMQVNTDGYGCMALDINHDILRHEWVDADMSGVEPDVVFGKLDAMAKAMAEDLESKRCIIAGVSCALPGLVTSDKRLLMARNLGWENVDLTTFDVMRGYDVTPCNEAKLAAIAQIPGYACARADVFDGVDCADSFLYLSCDIGIGGAIVRDGEIVSGSHGFAGEIGHVSVSLDGPLCGCGRRGCFEQYASASALLRETKRAMFENKDSLMWSLVGDVEKVDGKTAFDAAKAGDAAAQKVIKNYIMYLGEGILNLVGILRPQAILLGGGISNQGEFLLQPLRKYVSERLYVDCERVPLVLLRATLGNDAGIYGAYALVVGR